MDTLGNASRAGVIPHRGRYEFNDEDLTALGVGPNSSGNLGTSIITVFTSPTSNAMPYDRDISIRLIKGNTIGQYIDGTIYETNRHGTSPDGVYIDRASRQISYVRGPNSTSSSTYSINQYLFSDVPLTDITGGYIEVAVKSDLLRGYDCTIQLMNKELVVVPY